MSQDFELISSAKCLRSIQSAIYNENLNEVITLGNGQMTVILLYFVESTFPINFCPSSSKIELGIQICRPSYSPQKNE